eukprot:6175811-Pleurochrysis_carterae.AAC.1
MKVKHTDWVEGPQEVRAMLGWRRQSYAGRVLTFRSSNDALHDFPCAATLLKSERLCTCAFSQQSDTACYCIL